MSVWQVTGPMKCRRRSTGVVQEREITVAICANTFEQAAAKAAKRPWSVMDMKCEFSPDRGNRTEALVVRQSAMFEGARRRKQ